MQTAENKLIKESKKPVKIGKATIKSKESKEIREENLSTHLNQNLDQDPDLTNGPFYVSIIIFLVRHTKEVKLKKLIGLGSNLNHEVGLEKNLLERNLIVEPVPKRSD